jgi:hypothetical protein
MNTSSTPQGGIAIEPVVYPLNEGTATRLAIDIQQHSTQAITCQTYWQLLTDEGKQLAQGNYTLTEEQFATWGADNSVVNQYVADVIGVTIL